MPSPRLAERIQVKGLVQGVGFRPTVWRLAHECELLGEVWNDSEGVTIRIWGERQHIDQFCTRLVAESPPLARVDALDRTAIEDLPPTQDFRIIPSRSGPVHTGIVPDAATCPACQAEIIDGNDRRFRYPFTNCTHCGPRLSIVTAIPYDRINTSMREFPMCAQCQTEYTDPLNRRFHAQPNACPCCGPRVWLVDGSGVNMQPALGTDQDVIQMASALLAEGRILALKGIGGFHLACDATRNDRVEELRRRKGRYHKPFALMARDLPVIRRYAEVTDSEASWLQSPVAPIMLLQRKDGIGLPDAVAPGQQSLGFMLPYSPLHHLLLQDWDSPLVMTSGNLSEEPQCTDNRDATRRLQPLADAYLLHDRAIVNRLDDSVVKEMDTVPRVLRRARGFAPAPLTLPPGFERAAQLLALGGELKNSFCLVKDGRAILSQHLGDLEDALTFKDYVRTLELYRQLFDHRPGLLVGDLHPNYRTTRFGRQYAAERGLPWWQVQHHHAHITSVMAENQWPMDAGKVLGIALDGTGYGNDGSIWGGEFLLADYLDFERLGLFRPVALPGGSMAIIQPWRNSFAQLHSLFGWDAVKQRWGGLEPIQWLEQQPVEQLTRMIEQQLNAPLTSSCGRLFDALAALLGICRERISYEGQAAIELESSVCMHELAQQTAYAFAVLPDARGLMIDPSPCWQALMTDLQQGVTTAKLAARFHTGLASAVTDLAVRLARQHAVTRVALSGGVFQNRILFEQVVTGLRAAGLHPLTHQQIPANDGGLSLGQAVIGAARRIRGTVSC